MEKGILEAAASARSMKNLYAMKRWQLPKVQIVHPSVTMSNAIGENIELLEHLVPCGSVSVSCSKDPEEEEQPRNLTKWSSQTLSSGMQIYVELKGNVDIRLESQRIETKLKKILSTVEELNRKKITKDKPLSEAEMSKYVHNPDKYLYLSHPNFQLCGRCRGGPSYE